jgi:hypothetical protein
MKNPFQFLLPKKTTVNVPAERLKELERREFVLESVIATMAMLKGMAELETNLEMVLDHHGLKVPELG